jgi:hypothetical protein
LDVFNATWTSSDPNVATADPNGFVTGHGAGSAIISARWALYTYHFSPALGGCTSSSIQVTRSATATVVGVTISGPQSVQDGSFIDPTFTLTPQGGNPTSYQWAWSAPTGTGNNPFVTFNPSNQATTVTNRHWFANPNVACPSPPSVGNPPVSTDPYYNSVYTIIGQASFSGGQAAHKDTTLTVNNFWDPAGTTAPPAISGTLNIGFDSSSNLWVVVNSGNLTRNTPEVTINVPFNSQFYNKTVIHENRHRQQYVSGMNSDLFTVDSLMAQLSPLTDPTQAGLNAKIAQAFTAWLSGQNAAVIIRSSVMEADAYSISDNVPPQYAYQNCGRF